MFDSLETMGFLASGLVPSTDMYNNIYSVSNSNKEIRKNNISYSTNE